MVSYVHHIPGRLRVRSAVIKRNPSMAEALRVRLNGLAGVSSVDINPITGSICVTYRAAAIHSDRVFAELRILGDLSAPMAEIGGGMLEGGGGLVAKLALGFALEKLVERSAMALIGAVA